MSARIVQADYSISLSLCEGKADLVLTSPPYCDARTYGATVSWTDADYAALGDSVFTALRPGGWALVNVDAPVRAWRPGMGTERGLHPWRMLLDWTDRVGFRAPDRLAYGRQGTPGEYAGRFRNDWEPLLWFQKPGGDGYFDKRALERSAVRTFAGAAQRHSEDSGSRERRASGRAATEGIRTQGTFWDYGVVGKGHTGAADLEAAGHPARWPFRLAEDVVRTFCPPGGLACDPFLGAGTSMVAALAHGRRFVGGDLYARADGVPWVQVAAGIAAARGYAVSIESQESRNSRKLVAERAPDSLGSALTRDKALTGFLERLRG